MAKSQAKWSNLELQASLRLSSCYISRKLPVCSEKVDELKEGPTSRGKDIPVFGNVGVQVDIQLTQANRLPSFQNVPTLVPELLLQDLLCSPSVSPP